ncbi:MAG TPA: nucleotidyltransferase family protein [Vicinamibacterales bacterium]|nr:nucleotidyltransferase family protein [Vicinamibacterales bacterium]
MSEPEVLVAIPAAGASRRLGRPKQLVALGGEPLLRRQCRCALSAGVGPVLVILGCDADRHAQVIEDLPVEVCVNHAWLEGMAASLRHVVDAASERRAASLILQCDQYRVTPAELRTLYDTWRLAPASACVSCWDDYAGPPAIVPSEYYDDVRRLRGDVGARALLYDARRPRPTEVANPRATFDLDSLEDLEDVASSEARLWTLTPKQKR